jgi:hypothetical protein
VTDLCSSRPRPEPGLGPAFRFAASLASLGPATAALVLAVVPALQPDDQTTLNDLM